MLNQKPHAREASRKKMDLLTLFGLFAVTLMLVTYALEAQSHWYILAFAGHRQKPGSPGTKSELARLPA